MSVVPVAPAPRKATFTALPVTVGGTAVIPARGAMSIVQAAVAGAVSCNTTVAAPVAVTDPTEGGQVDDPHVKNAKDPDGMSEPLPVPSTQPAVGL